jgi:hypothetical protein
MEPRQRLHTGRLTRPLTVQLVGCTNAFEPAARAAVTEITGD